MAQYPSLNLDVEYSDRLANLNQENFDVAIRIGPLADSDLIAQPHLRQPPFDLRQPSLSCPERHADAPATPATAPGLLNIQREPTGMLQLPIEGEIRSFRIGKRLRTDNAFHLLAAAKSRFGPLAILPAFIAADAIRAGNCALCWPPIHPTAATFPPSIAVQNAHPQDQGAGGLSE